MKPGPRRLSDIGIPPRFPIFPPICIPLPPTTLSRPDQKQDKLFLLPFSCLDMQCWTLAGKPSYRTYSPSVYIFLGKTKTWGVQGHWGELISLEIILRFPPYLHFNCPIENKDVRWNNWNVPSVPNPKIETSARQNGSWAYSVLLSIFPNELC